MQAAVTTRRSPWVILLVLCLGFFMILLDLTIVNVAIPSIIDGLHAGLDEILWVLNAYILAYAVLLITAGRLGDMFGAPGDSFSSASRLARGTLHILDSCPRSGCHCSP
jgi:MFS family permease